MNTQPANSIPSRPASQPKTSRPAGAAAAAARQREIAAHFAGVRRPDLAHVAILGYN